MTTTLDILCVRLNLAASEVLYRFDAFDQSDWKKVCGTPKWNVHPDRIVGGGPDEPTHGQIFFGKPVSGEVVMEFDARILPPSYHDLVWFWNVDFRKKPWGAGYLGCLGGWWSDCAGIEKLPNYVPSAIAPSFKTRPGRKYHIVSGSAGGVNFIAVDGRLVTYFPDSDPPKGRPGYFGFGVYESMAEYSGLTVYRPSWERLAEPKYVPGTKMPKARLSKGKSTKRRKAK